MVTKQQLDNYFNSNYHLMSKLATNMINQKQKHYDSESILSNAYIYLSNKLKEIPQQEDIQKWLITYMKNETTWTNSQIAKEDRIKYTQEINELYDAIDEDDDIEYKIELELRYTKQKDILYQYRYNYLTDKQRQIVFDMYFVKGFSSSRKMGKHVNIHYVSAWKLIKEMKEDIYYFINNVYNKDN